MNRRRARVGGGFRPRLSAPIVALSLAPFRATSPPCAGSRALRLSSRSPALSPALAPPAGGSVALAPVSVCTCQSATLGTGGGAPCPIRGGCSPRRYAAFCACQSPYKSRAPSGGYALRGLPPCAPLALRGSGSGSPKRRPHAPQARPLGVSAPRGGASRRSRSGAVVGGGGGAPLRGALPARSRPPFWLSAQGFSVVCGFSCRLGKTPFPPPIPLFPYGAKGEAPSLRLPPRAGTGVILLELCKRKKRKPPLRFTHKSLIFFPRY